MSFSMRFTLLSSLLAVLLFTALAPVSAHAQGRPGWPYPPPSSIDTNGDGVISQSELIAFLVRMGLPEEIARKIASDDVIRVADTDHDGSISMAELDAYLRYVGTSLKLTECVGKSGDDLKSCIRNHLFWNSFKPGSLYRLFLFFFDYIWDYLTSSDGDSTIEKIIQLFEDYLFELVHDFGVGPVIEEIYLQCLLNGGTPQQCSEAIRQLLEQICADSPADCPWRQPGDECIPDVSQGLAAGGSSSLTAANTCNSRNGSASM